MDRITEMLLEAERSSKDWRMEPLKRYQRDDDMGDGSIGLLAEDDGDVIIFIMPDSPRKQMVDVQFCTIGAGGGRSPRTLAALRALAEAIELDNAECPQKRGDNA